MTIRPLHSDINLEVFTLIFAVLCYNMRYICARLSLGWRRSVPVTYKYRQLKNIDFDHFEAELLSSALFTDPAASTDRLADQLAFVVTSVLDKFAPLKTVMRKAGGKPINRFLSSDAKKAKQRRRRLERRWKRTEKEAHRRAYRSQCRITNELINESRRQYYADRIADIVAGPRKRWSAVNELLHAGRNSFVPEAEAKTQCEAISSYFAEKISRMKNVVASRLVGLTTDHF